jgi:hypothetical protein
MRPLLDIYTTPLEARRLVQISIFAKRKYEDGCVPNRPKNKNYLSNNFKQFWKLCNRENIKVKKHEEVISEIAFPLYSRSPVVL